MGHDGRVKIGSGIINKSDYSVSSNLAVKDGINHLEEGDKVLLMKMNDTEEFVLIARWWTRYDVSVCRYGIR